MKKIVIIAPFWFQQSNVGLLRIQSFINWLKEENYHVVIIAAGNQYHVKEESKLTIIMTKDPLGLYRVGPTGSAPITGKERRPNRLRRWLATLLFCPDASILWAKGVSKEQQNILPYIIESKAILSSSPPESSHILGYKLSKLTGVPLFLDFRDGWLDDSLKPLLRTSNLQRWREGRLEKKLIRYAQHIFFVTTRLTQLLVERFPEAKEKTTTLTNSYAESWKSDSRHYQRLDEVLSLYHVGRFTASDPKRKPELLLAPLLTALQNSQLRKNVKIVVVGYMNGYDLAVLEKYRESFKAYQWLIEVKEEVEREEALRYINHADGLLLLSIPVTALTRKIFEYICSGRPFLAVTPEQSALWEASVEITQAFLLPLGSQDTRRVVTQVSKFIEAADLNQFKITIPKAFSQEHVKAIFIDVLKKY